MDISPSLIPSNNACRVKIHMPITLLSKNGDSSYPISTSIQNQMEIEKEPPPGYKQLTFEHEADALTIELCRFLTYLLDL